MKKTFRTIKNQIESKLIDIAALIVAIAAVVITLIQGNTQVKLQKVGWQPYLMIEFLKANSEPEKGFLLKNTGNGPAVIQSFKYYKNEKDYKEKRSFEEWLNPQGYSNAVLLGFLFKDVNNLNEGYVIPNKTESDFFFIRYC